LVLTWITFCFPSSPDFLIPVGSFIHWINPSESLGLFEERLECLQFAPNELPIVQFVVGGFKRGRWYCQGGVAAAATRTSHRDWDKLFATLASAQLVTFKQQEHQLKQAYTGEKYYF